MAGGGHRLGDGSKGANFGGVETHRGRTIARVIDREQVLHVARLARLELSEAEIETMTVELAGILEHVDRISALELDSVEPTSHVVALVNALRADEPEASLPRERALAQAPDPSGGAFRVPSPQAHQEQ